MRAGPTLTHLVDSKRSPDGAQRNPGSLARDAAPDFAALHPGYVCFARPAANGYVHAMTIAKAVAKLPPDDLARFRAWFEQFDAARFDEKIERDAKSGKLASRAFCATSIAYQENIP